MSDLFDIDRFMPHGHCYSWDPGILWTSVISDALIFASYTAIPFTLVFLIMRKRDDLPFNWMFVCFGLFIVACGLTHLIEIITVWKPYYPISAIVKAITALASVPTAIILYRIAPRIVQLPSLRQLVHEQTLRLKAQADSEAKDRFIAVLSHELRTPLTPVAAGLDLLEEEFNGGNGKVDSESVREALSMVRRNLEMERTLINDLLDISAAARGKLELQFEPIDFAEILHQSVLAFKSEAEEKRIDLTFELGTKRTFVIGAAVRLRQIINNLLGNAMKFTPEGGRISIRLTADDKSLRLAVADSGCGIEAESLERIFQPFEQGERNGTGSRAGLGLGLAIARTIAESHGGRLTAQSRGPNRGAVFTFELPLVGQPQISNRQPTRIKITNGETKRKILLVEDHLDTLRTMASLLRKTGYSVETAENFRKAEPLLANAEVLISDIGLPDGDGCELMLRFKERGGTFGIAITGFGQEGDIARTRQAGFSKHLIKPIDIDVLNTALQEFRAPATS